MSHHNSSHHKDCQRNIATYCRGTWTVYAMSTMTCKYKVALELAMYKSRHLLVWYSRRSFPKKTQEMQVREKKTVFFLSLFS